MRNTIRKLINELNYYTKCYDEGNPIVNDTYWDGLYFELDRLEKQTKIIYPDSPTQTINYEVVNSLEKVKHNHLMLSLAKTKDIAEVLDFIDDKKFVIMAKMDGLTCSLRYLNGELVSAETRGDGEVGENILHNARVLDTIPQKIRYTGELVVDGEIVCSKLDFEYFENDYSNARNFAAGSIRLLDSKECQKRNLQFIAWDVIKGLEEHEAFNLHLQSLRSLGFTVVPWRAENGILTRERFEDLRDQMIVESANYPIDGLVIKFDNIEYGKALGRTDHHFNNAIAFKFEDEKYETELLDIEYEVSRNGEMVPVAVFNPIQIEGTTVQRCSLFNLSVLENKLGKPYVGQKIWISKRNMVIPYIEKAEKTSK